MFNSMGNVRYCTMSEIRNDKQHFVDELKEMEPESDEDIELHFTTMDEIISTYNSYDELKEVLNELNRIFGYEAVTISVRNTLDHSIRSYNSNGISYEKMLDVICTLADEGILVNFYSMLYGNLEFRIKLYRLYNNATNVGKAIISLMLYNELSYTYYKYSYNQVTMIRYMSFVNLYENVEEFKQDIDIHRLIIRQGFGDGTASVKKFFTIKNNPYYYGNSDLTRTNESIYTEFIKVIFELADEYNFNKRQLDVLYKFMTGKRYQMESTVFNEFTRIPYIYNDKLKFYQVISEVNKKASKVYAELMLD